LRIRRASDLRTAIKLAEKLIRKPPDLPIVWRGGRTAAQKFQQYTDFAEDRFSFFQNHT
jgi:hypothetical protein